MPKEYREVPTLIQGISHIDTSPTSYSIVSLKINDTQDIRPKYDNIYFIAYY